MVSVHVATTLLLGSMIVAGVARSDSPPSWEPFKVCSQNARFCAEVGSDDAGTKDPWNRRYSLRVSDASGRVLWSAGYAYDGYPDGLLSDDGAAFVYINTWYSEKEPVVSVYSKGGRNVIPGSAFNVKKVLETASHFVWLDWKHSPRFASPSRLELRTLDGKVHVVDTETARIVTP